MRVISLSATKATSGRTSWRHVGPAVTQGVTSTPNVLGIISANVIKVIRQTIKVFASQCVPIRVTEIKIVWHPKHAPAHLATYGTTTLRSVCPSAFPVVRWIASASSRVFVIATKASIVKWQTTNLVASFPLSGGSICWSQCWCS